MIYNIAKIFFSHYLNKNHIYKKQIDPILEFKSFLRVKPKGKLLDTKNKEQSQTKARLDNSIYYKLSRFEYKEGKNKSKNTLIKKLDLNKR